MPVKQPKTGVEPMKIASIIARYLMGLVFTVFGLNGFLHFLPAMLPPHGSPAADFTGAMASTGYMSVVFAVQLLCGLLFLANFYLLVALLIIAPVIFNILLFHATMAPAGIVPGLIVTVLWAIVTLRHRTAFAGLFRPRVPA
jgi:putative oxidoreductase